MVKRSAAENQVSAGTQAENTLPHKKSAFLATSEPNTNVGRDINERDAHADVEMGEFEDPWEDELEQEEEEEEIILDRGEADMEGDDDMDMEEDDDEEEAKENVKVYLPGQPLQEGEVLEMDQSAYDMYHALNMEWPCLSFDILADGLGQDRTKFPMTAYFVTGTQADEAKNNKLIVMKASQLHRTKHSEDSDDEESDLDDLDEDPILEHRSFAHEGGVNRIRVMPHPEVQIVASWADTGKVHIWDVTDAMKSISVPGTKFSSAAMRPLYTVTAHSTEGFAMDWSKRIPGRLLTGDCRSDIFLTERRGTEGWHTEPEAFQGHAASIEDLQWSPTQDQVFASCSVDQTVKIWDTRMRKRAGMSMHVHTTDVNVISWNPNTAHLLASGADDGSFSVWDLRQWKGDNGAQPQANPAASFQWHRGPITSIEWHPKDSSVLAVSGADDQLTLWDFSVEPDTEEDMGEEAPEVPPQLMFIHQGQQDTKELHWHPQIPGMLLSTSATGFNLFKTISF